MLEAFGNLHQQTVINGAPLVGPESNGAGGALDARHEHLVGRALPNHGRLDAIDVALKEIEVDLAEADVFALPPRPVGGEHQAMPQIALDADGCLITARQREV